MNSPSTLVFERGFACYFITDYEKSDRTWISYLLFSYVFLSSVAVSLAAFFGMMNRILASAIVISISAIGLGVFIFAWHRTGELMGGRTKETLSVKYQLRENLRAYHMLLNVMRGGTMAMTTAFIYLLIYMLMPHDQSQAAVWGAAVDALLAWCMLCPQAFVVISQSSWKKRLVRQLLWFRDRTGPMKKDGAISVMNLSFRQMTALSEQNFHFEALNSAWSIAIADKQRRESTIRKRRNDRSSAQNVITINVNIFASK